MGTLTSWNPLGTSGPVMGLLTDLAGTEYELPEDDAIASKHVGAVQQSAV